MKREASSFKLNGGSELMILCIVTLLRPLGKVLAVKMSVVKHGSRTLVLGRETKATGLGSTSTGTAVLNGSTRWCKSRDAFLVLPQPEDNKENYF